MEYGPNKRENSISVYQTNFPIRVTYFSVTYYSSWRETQCGWLTITHSIPGKTGSIDQKV